MKNIIEVEFRSLLSKKQYDSLHKFLDTKGQFLGKDDKNVFFFILPDKELKVADNISQKNAKIALKLNKLGKGNSSEEIEILIDQKDVNNAVDFFTHLGFKDIIESFQKRLNYKYKNVEIALKQSKHWEYHIELEIIVTNKSKIKQAEKKIREIAKELKIKLMTNKELLDFTENVIKLEKINELKKSINNATQSKKSFKNTKKLINNLF